MKGHGQTKVWVISLASASSRRTEFESRSASQLPWEFWDAHTALASDLSYDAIEVPGDYGRALQTAELGCYSSHYALWKWLVHSGQSQMFVIEDDVAADWPYLELLSKVDFSSLNIDYLRLFAKMPAPFRTVASPFLDRYRHLVSFKGYPLGTQAYVLTVKGAQKLLARGSNVIAPVDVYMDRYWDHGVLNLAIWPFPVYERFSLSHIGDARMEAHRLRKSGRYVRNLAVKVRRRMSYLWNVAGPAPAAEKKLAMQLQSSALLGSDWINASVEAERAPPSRDPSTLE